MQPFDVACLVGRPRHVDMADQREHPPCALSLHRSTNSVCASHLDGSLARRAKIHVGLQQTPLKLATLLDYIALQLRVRGSHHLGRRQALLHDRKMPSRGPECIELFNLPASFHQGHLREIRPNGQRTDSDTPCFSMDRCVAMDPHPTEYDKDPAAGTKTRPDADNSKAAIDVKSVPDTPNPDGSPRKVYTSEQLRAQREGAQGDGKDHVVIISNGNKDNVEPSGPLGKAPPDGSTVLHHDPSAPPDSAWSKWDPGANKGAGGWTDITPAEAKSLTGGT